MLTFQMDPESFAVRRVDVTDDALIVTFKDGRVLSTPVAWYPALASAKPDERHNVYASTSGLHWPDLDEDLSFAGMIRGQRSNWTGRTSSRIVSRLEDKTSGEAQRRHFAFGNLAVDDESVSRERFDDVVNHLAA